MSNKAFALCYLVLWLATAGFFAMLAFRLAIGGNWFFALCAGFAAFCCLAGAGTLEYESK